MRTSSHSSKSPKGQNRLRAPRSVGALLRAYVPWVAVVCAGAYLPPKLIGALTDYHWRLDAGDTWQDAATMPWTVAGSPTVAFPSTVSDRAVFDTDFTANRTISLNVNSAIYELDVADPIPPNALTITSTAANSFQMQAAALQAADGTATGGLNINVSIDNGLFLNASAAGAAVLTNSGAALGALVKSGIGTLTLGVGLNTYTGGTYIESGILSVSSLALGGATSSIGASSSAAGNLVINGGNLTYTGAGASTDRNFTMGPDVYDTSNGTPVLTSYGATITASGTGAVAFTQALSTTAVAFVAPGSRTLVLRGTSVAANQFDPQINDPNTGPNADGTPATTTLKKDDAGLWRITNENFYTGQTLVQRGTLSLDYTHGPQMDTYDNQHPSTSAPFNPQAQSPQSRIPDGSTVVLGGLPGGGILDLFGVGVVVTGTVANPIYTAQNHEEFIGGLIIGQGANQITQTGAGQPVADNTSLYIPNISSTPNLGGTVRVSAANFIYTNDAGSIVDPANQVFGYLPAWININDDWAVSGRLVPFPTNGGQVKPHAGEHPVVALNGSYPDPLFPGQNYFSGGYTVVTAINNPVASWNVGEQIQIQSTPFDAVNTGGGDYVNAFSLQFSANSGLVPEKSLTIADSSTLNIVGGGLMNTSSSGNAYIVDAAGSQFPGGLTTANGQFYIIARSSGLYLATQLVDFFSSQSVETPVGFNKSGTGNVIFQNVPQNIGFGHHGDDFINEGTLIVRSNYVFGETTGYSDSTITTLGQTFINGGVLDLQGVNYYTPEIINIYAGSIAASQGKSNFAGTLNSAYVESQATLNIGTWLQIDPTYDTDGTTVLNSLTGVSGFVKSGNGMLVVNVPTNISDNRSIFFQAGDLSLTAGNSVWNSDITLGATVSGTYTGAININAGNNSFSGNLLVGRVLMNGGNTSLLGNGATYASPLVISAGTLYFGSMNQPIAMSQTQSKALNVLGGTLVLNGNLNVTGSFISSGTVNEATSVLVGAIPTVKWSNAASPVVFNSTTNLSLNNTFTPPVTIAAGVAFSANGPGATLFAGGLAGVTAGVSTYTAGTLNLFNTAFGTLTAPVNLQGLTIFAPVSGASSVATVNLNGSDTITGVFRMTNGILNEAGTLRQAGAYGVRNNFSGGIILQPANGGTVQPLFRGADSVASSILVNGVPSVSAFLSLPGISYPGFNTLANVGVVDPIFSNALAFTGNLRLPSGRVTFESNNALGTGNVVLGDSGIAASKAIFDLQRGAATPAGTATTDTLIVGTTYGYVSGVVVTNKGTGYTTPVVTIAAPTIGGSTTASVTGVASGGAFTGINFSTAGNTVGSGYVTVPAVTVTGGTSGAATAVVSGSVILRASDSNPVFGGNVIIDNTYVNASAKTLVSAAAPVISVAADRSLGIGSATTNIYTSTVSGSTVDASSAGRFLTTATIGGLSNSGNGYIFLDGQVRDISTGFSTVTQQQLHTDWGIAGAQELNVLVNQPWNANGLITLSSGVMRFTAPVATPNFFATGVTPSFELSPANTEVTSVGWNNVNMNIGLFLTRPGQAFNALALTVNDGNTDKYGLAGANTGNITIGGENTTGTVTYGTGTGTVAGVATASTITLATDNTTEVRDLRFYANGGGAAGGPGGTVDIKATLVKNQASGTTGSITKIGDGTVELLGGGTTATGTGTAGTVDKVNVLGGTLTFTGYDTYSATRVAAAAQLTLGGGTVKLLTPSTGAVVPAITFTGAATLRPGGSAVVTSGTNNGTIAIAGTTTTGSSTITRNVGATLRLDQATTTGGNIYLNPSAGSLTRGVPLGWTTYGTNADPTTTNAALGFAMAAASTGLVSQYTGAVATLNVSTWGATANHYQEGTSAATGYTGIISGSATAGSIQFNSTLATASTITVTGALTVNEGILVTSNASSAGRSITGAGTLAGGATYGDLIIQNYGPTLTIDARIIGLKSLSVGGDGTTVLTNAANSFTGTVFVNTGTLQFNSDTALGAAANTFQLEGGTLAIPASSSITTPRNIQIYGDHSTLSAPSTSTLTVTGVISSENSVPVNYTGSVNVYDGDLYISGGGTVMETSATNNTYTGQTIITGGVGGANGSRLVYEGTGVNFLGTNVSNLDSTTVGAGSALELHTTTTTLGTTGSFIAEALHLNGAGQSAGSGALRVTRATTGIGTLNDREVFWGGPVTLDTSATIFVDDQPEVITFATNASALSYTSQSYANMGILHLYDGILDGGGNTLTKTGNGVLRLFNTRVQNLSAIVIQGGELRFDSGITGTIGTAAGTANPFGASGFYSNTNLITVSAQGTGTTAATTPYAGNPRLWFNDVRGFTNANLALNGGLLIATSTDAPLQATSFSGSLKLTGNSSVNGFEVGTTGTKANPTMMLGNITDISAANPGGFTKFGQNELQLLATSDFHGQMVIARGSFNAAAPSVGLYDNGRLTNVTSIALTNDASFHIDNRDGVGTAGLNNNDRINNSAAIQLSGNARVRLLGSASAASFETVGALQVHAGSNSIELDPGVLNPTTTENVGLIFGSYTRDVGGVVQFRVLEPNSTFGTTPGATGGAEVILSTPVAAPLLVGGAGAAGTVTQSIVIGAFGGVALKGFSSIPANSPTAGLLNNNEELFVGRQVMTTQVAGGATYLRPLTAAEYYVPTPAVTGVPLNQAQTAFIFDTSNATSHTFDNVRLTGGFGGFSSATYESNFADEGQYELDQTDQSRNQESFYKFSQNTTINSLSIAATATEFQSSGGNRIAIDISPNRVLTVTSGMIVDANTGLLSEKDPSATDVMDQRAYIRGGTLDAGANEFIINNVASTFHEVTGAWNSTPGLANSTLSGTNLNWDLAIYSSLTGTGGLTKSGPGALVLGGFNSTYTGVTNLTEGMLRLESSKALGNSSALIVSGTGEVHLRRGIEIGTAPGTGPILRFTQGAASANYLRNDGEYNQWDGAIQIDSANTSGENVRNTNITLQVNSTLVLGGPIYGLDANSATVGSSPLNDLDRTRTPRAVVFSDNGGGVLQLKGSFSDTQPRDIGGGVISGAVAIQAGFSVVNSGNEDQVMRGVFAGGAARSNYLISAPWDSAGSISFRQGVITLLPAAGSQFYTTTAMNRINTFNTFSRPVFGDSGGGDTALLLTTALQDFNSPTLLVQNNQGDASYTIGGSNTSGTVKFMAPIANSFNDVNQRVSNWDRNVRLFATTGGTVEVDGKITDTGITGNGGFTKVGAGTVVLKGMDAGTTGWSTTVVPLGAAAAPSVNDFDKQIAVAGGLLQLDYGTNHVGLLTGGVLTNGWGQASTVGLSLAGGRLQLLGDATNAVAQTYASLTVRPGSSEIALVSNATTASAVTLTLGGATTFTQYQGSTSGNTGTPALGLSANGGAVNFVNPLSNSGLKGYIVVSATGGASGNLGGPGSVLGAWATVGTAPGVVTDFAYRDDATGTKTTVPNALIGLASSGLAAYKPNSDTPSAWAAGTYVAEGTGFSSATAVSGVKLITMGAKTAASTLNLPAGFTLGNGGTTDEGAILIPTGVTAAKTIAGNSIQSSGAKDLFIDNYGTGGLTISSAIAGTGNTVYAGPGTTTLSGTTNSTYTGKTFISGGSVLSVTSVGFQAVAGTMGQPGFNPGYQFDNLGAIPGAGVTDNLTITGGTLRFTGVANIEDPDMVLNPILDPNHALVTIQNGAGILSANRGVVLGGDGATFDVSTPTTRDVLQINGTINSTGSAALQAGSTTTYAARNPYVGDLIKTGQGILGLNNTTSYTGLTDIKQGILSIMTTGATLGTNTGALDQTIVETGATLRLNHSNGGLTLLEWLDFKPNSNLQVYYPSGTGQSTNLDGVVTLEGATTISYVGDYQKAGTNPNFTASLNSVAGNSLISISNTGGYLRGSGTLIKNGVNNGTYMGGLSFNQNNPEWTGGLVVNGGKVFVRSGGTPLGTGTTALQLGTTGPNDTTTTATGALVAKEADLFFAPLNAAVASGATTFSGSTDGVPTAYHISQDIVVNAPSTGTQLKQIGITNGLNGATAANQFDTYNFDGKLTLNDDLNLYVDGSEGNTPAGGETIAFNLNGGFTAGAGNLHTLLNFTGRTTGTPLGTYNNLFVNFNLAGASNAAFTGGFVVGNSGTIILNYNNAGSSVIFGNSDLNHVLNVMNPNALNSNNFVAFLYDSTLRLNGNSVTMGSIRTSATSDLTQEYTSDAGPTFQAVFKSGVNPLSGTTADLVDQNPANPGVTPQNTFIHSIVENRGAAPATLTVNQTTNSTWNVLIRDGVLSNGTAAGALTLVKTGSGIAEIQHGNYYTGGTVVNGGILQVTNPIGADLNYYNNTSPIGTSATGSGSVTVNPGGTLRGTGYISGSVSVSGTLGPGRLNTFGTNEPGILNLGSDSYFGPNLSAMTSVNNGATLAFTLLSADNDPSGRDPTDPLLHDQVVTQALTLSGNVNIKLFLDSTQYRPAPQNSDPSNLAGDDHFTIVRSFTDFSLSNVTFLNNGAPSSKMIFTYNYPDGTTPASIFLLTKNVVTDDGTPTGAFLEADLVLISVPEPGTVGALASGLGMLLGLQRFRRGRRGARA